MTLVLYKNIDLCLALKKWNDYMGWGRILYLDLWVWESKRNGSPILISSDPLIEEGQRQKKWWSFKIWTECKKKYAFLPEHSPHLISSFWGIFPFSFRFFSFAGSTPFVFTKSLQDLSSACHFYLEQTVRKPICIT